jgi:hypothetical protein
MTSEARVQRRRLRLAMRLPGSFSRLVHRQKRQSSRSFPPSPHLTSTPTRHTVTPTQHRAATFHVFTTCASCCALITDFSRPISRTARSSSRDAALAGKVRAQEEATTTQAAVARHIAPSASASVAGGSCCAWCLVRDCLPVCPFVRTETR